MNNDQLLVKDEGKGGLVVAIFTIVIFAIVGYLIVHDYKPSTAPTTNTDYYDNSGVTPDNTNYPGSAEPVIK